MVTRSTSIYLDNNATTRPAPAVVETVRQTALAAFGNPGSRHAAGRRGRQVLDRSRDTLARLLGAAPEEVVFTSGGTESNFLAIQGLAHGPPGIIALTPGEHPSVLENCRALRQRGHELRFLELDPQGRLRPESWQVLPWNEVRLVCVILAHNETGVLQDIATLSALCREHNVPLHLDAVQAVGRIDVHFGRLGAASLSLGSHKFHGPRGAGALLVRDGSRLVPQIMGGHQERDRRGGTEPVALIAGMTHALELFAAESAERQATLRQLRDRFEQAVCANSEGVVIQGAGAARLPNTTCLGFPDCDGEALLVALDLEGVCCSLGSACASGAAEPAPVLLAMGCSPELARRSLRFSLGIDNTPAEVERAAEIVSDVVTRLRCAPAPLAVETVP